MRIKKAKPAAVAAKHKPVRIASAGVLVGSGGGSTLDQQIDQYQRSAKFWLSSGAAVDGSDPTVALVFSAACEEQAFQLMARKARSEGRGAEAGRLGRKASKAHAKWAVAHGPKQQTTGGGMGMSGSGMPGMMGPEGMGGPGGPGMPGMGGPPGGMQMSGPMGGPGMGGPPPGMGGPPPGGMGTPAP